MIDVRFDKTAGVTTSWIKAVAGKVLKAERSRMSLSILLTGDVQIRKINKRFLKHDHTTDVISFATGDIVVSVDTARRWAKALGIRTREELARYLVHGVLHLLGYDDKKTKDFERMHKRQEQLLRAIL